MLLIRSKIGFIECECLLGRKVGFLHGFFEKLTGSFKNYKARSLINVDLKHNSINIAHKKSRISGFF